MPAKSQLSRPPLARMMKIHDALRSEMLVNCTKLTKTLEVSRKTIVRDIAFMRDQLDLPIEFDSKLGAYRYTSPVSSFPTVNVTEGELLALLVAQRALEQYRGTPFHHQLEVAFDKLAGALRDTISFSPADELRTVSFKNIGLGKTDLAVFNPLSAAVLRHEEVTFRYRKPGTSKASERRVHPYHLANRENLWYLIGFDVARQALRTFALPRISAVAKTQTQFERPADFSPETFFANALGVLGGTGDYLVVIRFSAVAAERVREREWHESQELRELPEGELELEMRLGALEEATQWILGWGTAAEVIAPPELRSKITQTVEALAKVYTR
jgi:predicted DNA-binding transcriptional regulator YafY